MAKMTPDEFEEFIKVNPEKELWLKTVASTCLAHKQYIETRPLEKQSMDDQGMNELSSAILFMYGLLIQNGILKGYVAPADDQTH